MEKTLREQLLDLLKWHSEWVHKGDLLKTEIINTENGTTYMPETVGRALRQLESEGLIAVKKDKNKKSVCYKHLTQEEKASYIPQSKRLI